MDPLDQTDLSRAAVNYKNMDVEGRYRLVSPTIGRTETLRPHQIADIKNRELNKWLLV